MLHGYGLISDESEILKKKGLSIDLSGVIHVLRVLKFCLLGRKVAILSDMSVSFCWLPPVPAN